MPLDLKPPRKGKSPNWSIRGTYLGVRVDKSCGTAKRSVAARILSELERKIERGEYPPKNPAGGKQPRTFLEAAVAYLEAGKRARYVKRLIQHFGETPLCEIGQAEMDAAAAAICPNGGPGARNAAVYTPACAIIRNAGVDLKLKRPPGAKGRVVTDWLTPDDAAAIIRAAETFDRELALLLTFLLYTGVRLNEALALTWDDLLTDQGEVWMRRSKGGKAGGIKLRADLHEALQAHREASSAARVFRFHQGGHLKHQLVRAKLTALGLPCPARRPVGWKQPPNRLRWVNFHTFRHTFATWMRRYGKVDVQGLVEMGNWRDPRSAARYAHAVAREEWSRVESLPSVTIRERKAV